MCLESTAYVYSRFQQFNRIEQGICEIKIDILQAFSVQGRNNLNDKGCILFSKPYIYIGVERNWGYESQKLF